MRKLHLTFTEVLFLVMTHLVLGAGLALLLAPRMTRTNRRRLGQSLTALGVATAPPRFMVMLSGWRRSAALDRRLNAAQAAALEG